MIGVHTPEFGFEHNVDNIRPPRRRCGSSIRSRSTTTTRSGRLRQPLLAALYFVDAKGEIRHHHFGEGEYEQSERSSSNCSGCRSTGGTATTASRSTPGHRSRSGLGQSAVARELPRLRRTETSCPGRRRNDESHAVRGPRAAGAQPMGARAATGRSAGGRVHKPTGDRVPVSRARPAPVMAAPRAGRRYGSACSSTARRPGVRTGSMSMITATARRETAPLSAHPATRPRHRSAVRDRVPRPGRGGVLLHVR